jgi:serine/threonine kinase 32
MTKSPKHRFGHGPQGFEKLKSHSWFRGLDWESLENKTANPPFIPNVSSIIYNSVNYF